jgi:4-amino-4-deoxy-L-arabinose transferase-like glycosyltransferase
MFNFRKIIRHPLTWIIILAAVLRLWQLGAADVITDEVFYAFRGLGYLDYDVGLTQTSPIQWLDVRPWWSRLSFHDHPPLIFLINFFFLKLGGISTWIIRLPAVIAGLGSVVLVYLIGGLKNSRVGLVASLLLAVSTYHVWISRIGLQESVVIFLLLLTSFYYLRWTADKSSVKSWGISLGFLWLTKFTGFILIPIIFCHQLIIRQLKKRWKQLVAAFVIAVALFSPVILYNLILQFRFGHLDFQFSYLLGQHPAIWLTHKGKDLGTVADKLHLLVYNFFTGESIVLAILMVIAALIVIALVVKKIWHHEKIESLELYVVLALIFQLILLTIIGGTERFTAMLLPWLALAGALSVEPWLINKWRRILLGVLLIFVGFGSINSFWFSQPLINTPALTSSLRVNSAEWGYNQLDSYLNQELAHKKPSLTFPTRYSWLESLRQQALAGQGSPTPILIVYDHRLDQAASLWYLHRRLVYDAWPVIPDTNFAEESGGKIEYWRDMGFKTIYVIKGRDTLYDLTQTEEVAIQIPTSTPKAGVSSQKITTTDGTERFEVTKIEYN